MDTDGHGFHRRPRRKGGRWGAEGLWGRGGKETGKEFNRGLRRKTESWRGRIMGRRRTWILQKERKNWRTDMEFTEGGEGRNDLASGLEQFYGREVFLEAARVAGGHFHGRNMFRYAFRMAARQFVMD